MKVITIDKKSTPKVGAIVRFNTFSGESYVGEYNPTEAIFMVMNSGKFFSARFEVDNWNYIKQD